MLLCPQYGVYYLLSGPDKVVAATSPIDFSGLDVGPKDRVKGSRVLAQTFDLVLDLAADEKALREVEWHEIPRNSLGTPRTAVWWPGGLCTPMERSYDREVQLRCSEEDKQRGERLVAEYRSTLGL